MAHNGGADKYDAVAGIWGRWPRVVEPLQRLVYQGPTPKKGKSAGIPPMSSTETFEGAVDSFGLGTLAALELMIRAGTVKLSELHEVERKIFLTGGTVEAPIAGKSEPVNLLERPFVQNRTLPGVRW